MKKILLILLSLSFGHLTHSNCQQVDSLERKGPKIWKSINLNCGILSGWQTHVHDTVSLSTAIPVGINFRVYPKNHGNYNTFFDVDIALFGLVVNEHKRVGYFKASLGVGAVAKYYNAQIHFSYLYNSSRLIRSQIGPFYQMYGIGYELETQSIPLTLEVFTPFKSKFLKRDTFFLLGIKIPLYNLVLNDKIRQ